MKEKLTAQILLILLPSKNGKVFYQFLFRFYKLLVKRWKFRVFLLHTIYDVSKPFYIIEKLVRKQVVSVVRDFHCNNIVTYYFTSSNSLSSPFVPFLYVSVSGILKFKQLTLLFIER